MEQIVKKVEDIASKVLAELEEKPFRTIMTGVLTVWLIGKVAKSLKK